MAIMEVKVFLVSILSVVVSACSVHSGAGPGPHEVEVPAAAAVSDSLFDEFHSEHECGLNQYLDILSVINENRDASKLDQDSKKLHAGFVPESALNLEKLPKLEELPNFEKLKEEIWEDIENHQNNAVSLVEKFESKNSSPHHQDELKYFLNEFKNISSDHCSEFCRSINLQKIYESYFSSVFLRLRKSPNAFPSSISEVFKKILKAIPEDQLHKNLEEWVHSLKSDDPSTFRMPIANEPSLSDRDKIKRIENGQDIALFMDFIFYFFGRNSTHQYSSLRDQCYRNSIVKSRGIKETLQIEGKSNHIGVVEVDYLKESEVMEYKRSYKRDVWAMGSSEFLRSAAVRQIPVVCNISGTTNLMLWGLANFPAPLTAQEFRVFLLSLWVALTGDGGHTLQEVLTSAHLVNGFMEKELKPTASNQKAFLASLSEVMSSIAPIGKGMGFYYRDFFSHFAHEEWFLELRSKAQTDFEGLWNQSCRVSH